MIYDPSSNLFWWSYLPLHRTQPDSAVETDNENFLKLFSIFVADDRIAVFSGIGVLDSTQHYPDFPIARTHVVSVLETMRGNIQAGRGGSPLASHVLNGVPPYFFHKCWDAGIDFAQIKASGENRRALETHPFRSKRKVRRTVFK